MFSPREWHLPSARPFRRKVGEAVLGLEVPHAHIHLIPMQNEKDMLFSNPKLKLTDEEFKAVAEAIRAVL